MENCFEDPTWRRQENDLVNQLIAIFPCSFVIDNGHIIRNISTLILDMLGFQPSDVIGKHVSFLSHDVEFKNDIQKKLTNGFFHNYPTYIKNSCAINVLVNLSGFNSKIFSKEGELIVIQVENIEERQITEIKLLEKTRQLEALLHCAWHDLRGPIATIKGIITLANMRKDDNEIQLYFEWISSNADRLDNELKRLLERVHSLNSTPQDARQR